MIIDKEHAVSVMLSAGQFPTVSAVENCVSQVHKTSLRTICSHREHRLPQTITTSLIFVSFDSLGLLRACLLSDWLSESHYVST